ncbi:MAG: GntR family transcriptional regulator [Burkholderiales bacterium]|jgi:DNA-binding GntR family transcriptional regulator|nr:GntR family transcriptional regulator [Burkholderiales bacterium]NCV85327.1 GntR family transcriptional regulator [Oxalobacteraceae bacterium]
MKILESQPKLVEQVHKAILSEIAEGKLKAGSRIIQEQIAQELGVSRQPVQQSLVLLKNQGVLIDAPGRGLQVAPLNLELIRQMYEVRAVLEGLVFRKAAENFSETAKKRAEKLLAAGRQAVTKASVRDLISADMAFHSFFYELADNPIITQSMETQWVNTQRVMGSVLLSADKPRDIWDEHEVMLGLVAAGEAAKAERLARTHIEEAAGFMIERLSEQIAENAS